MNDLLQGLNPAQREAVTTVAGPILTLAGPGSGKTRALTHRIAYLVEQHHIAPWRILAVTFTNKAAREMKIRLESMLPDGQVHRLNVGTFHSLCARWLRREVETLGYYSSNFVIYDTSDQEAMVKRALRELDLDEKRWRPGAMQRVISSAKNEMITPDKFQARTYQEEVTARVYNRYQELLVENNAVDFDDLLLVTHLLFRRHPEVLERYQEQFIQVMVDEFQDTNMVQYDLVKMLAGKHGNLFAVGDIDQGIFSWRGADYRNVLQFQKDYPQHKIIRLSQNYRSTDTIVEAAKQIIRKNKQRIDNDLFTERGTGAKIQVVESYDAEEEAAFVASEIKRLSQTEQISPGKMAVMYRTNAQSRLLEEAFINRGMPYLLVRGTRFYDRREIKDALAYLRLLYNPQDSVSLSRIINVPTRGIGPKAIGDLDRWAFELRISPSLALFKLLNEPLEHSPFTPRTAKSLIEFATILGLLLSAKETLNLTEFFDLLMARTGYKTFINDKTEEGEERWENLLELRRAMSRFENSPAHEVLGQFLEEVALVADADALKEDEANATALLTLHTAKGLEFPVVFLVGMEEGLFPHSRSTESVESMEEERRLAYVGVTRAKDRLYLTRAFRRQKGYNGFSEPSDPSRFLKDISPDLLENGNQRATRVAPTTVKPTIRWDKNPSPVATTLSYKTGDKVRHATFGDGTVITSKLDGGQEYAQIAFTGHGIKNLAVSLAKLERR